MAPRVGKAAPDAQPAQSTSETGQPPTDATATPRPATAIR